uniref:Uncharacterized protein n=1 Tax=Arundo donax TaxID=35708 RepID=A0A0A8YTA3_ARUDO
MILVIDTSLPTKMFSLPE